MSSYRRRIIDSIATRIRAIHPGHHFDLPNGAYTCQGTITTAQPWRLSPFGSAEIPGVAWRDRAVRASGEPFGIWPRYQLQLAIAGYLSGSAPAAAARTITADLLAAVGSDQRHDGYAEQTFYLGSRLLERTTGDVVAVCQLDFAILYMPVPLADEGNRMLDEVGNILTDESGDTLTW